MEPHRLHHFENLVNVVCTSTNKTERTTAQAELNKLLTVENIPYFSMLIRDAHDLSPLALSQAMGALTHLVTQQFDHIKSPEALELMNTALHFLHTRGAAAPHYLRMAATRLVCRIVKKGWFRLADFRHCYVSVIIMLGLEKIPEPMNNVAIDSCFLPTTKPLPGAKWANRLVALYLLQELILELDHPCSGESTLQHRKLVVSVRSNLMLHIVRFFLHIYFFCTKFCT